MLVVIATSRGGGKKMGGSLFKMKEGGNNRYSHRFLILLLFTYIQQMGIYVYAYNISDFLHFFPFHWRCFKVYVCHIMKALFYGAWLACCIMTHGSVLCVVSTSKLFFIIIVGLFFKYQGSKLDRNFIIVVKKKKLEVKYDNLNFIHML